MYMCVCVCVYMYIYMRKINENLAPCKDQEC